MLCVECVRFASFVESSFAFVGPERENGHHDAEGERNATRAQCWALTAEQRRAK